MDTYGDIQSGIPSGAVPATGSAATAGLPAAAAGADFSSGTRWGSAVGPDPLPERGSGGALVPAGAPAGVVAVAAVVDTEPAVFAAPPRVTWLLGETSPARRRVLRHPMYRQLAEPADVRVFMEHHVFAVWDFMSLLTVLQRQLTCVEIPWTPRGNPEARRLVNEIVLTEESDLTSNGPRSHFELYLEAMAAAGADTTAVRCFLDLLADGIAVPDAVELCGAPPAAAAFVRHTWRIVEHAPVHCVAAAFALGREELVPRMFEHVLDEGDPGAEPATGDGDFGLFREYLQRHIEVDGDEHGPMALRLLEDLCGTDARRWRECAGTVTVALRARSTLWDAVAAAMTARSGAAAG